MKPYELKIVDRDGVEQNYHVKAGSLWAVFRLVSRCMATGDFYGHVEAETIEVSVCELIPEAMQAHTDFMEA